MVGKISELALLQGAIAASNDLVEVIDVSDTSMSATGTNKKISLADLNAVLVYPGQLAPPVGQYLSMYGMGAHSAAGISTTTTLSRATQLTPFFVPFEMSFDMMSLYISTAPTDAGSVFRYGVYAATPGDGKPGALVLDAGTVIATGAAGLRSVNVALTLPPGLYYSALSFQTATTAGTNPACYKNTHQSIVCANNIATAVAASMWTSIVVHPAALPANISADVSLILLAAVPRLLLRRSA